MKKLLCYIFGHTWVSMKDVPNPRYHDCEWCERCKTVKDFSKFAYDYIETSIHTHPFEMICGHCDTVIGYMKEKPEDGSPIMAKQVVLLNGKQAQEGCRIDHECGVSTMSNWKCRKRV